MTAVALSSTTMRCLVPLFALTACAPTAADPTVIVLQQVVFGRESEGVSEGFDLDGTVSIEDGADGCGHGDFVDSAGRSGVDNAMANLMPVLEATEARAVESLIQQAINMGELLLLVQLADGPDGTDVTVLRGSGVPDIGTDGYIEPYQTFDRSAETTPSTVTASASAPEVEARGFTVHLPLQIFDADLDLILYDAGVRVALGDDGAAHGIVSGAFPYRLLLDGLEGANVDAGLLAALPLILENNADLDSPDGPCSALSVTLDFVGTRAFLFDE